MSTLDARPANRLGSQTSPYLRQHAHNPVDWYPWGEEALARARREDRPILLSVGYSACHWCHVMERESFESPATAALMNELFVNVKVDREERPDLDQIYQLVVQLMGRGGGWPLTVFLTPDLRPFFGGTYFPPAPRYGMPSFSEVLRGVSDAYTRRRDDVEKSAQALTDGIREATRPNGGEVDPPRDLLERATRRLADRSDDRNGGFGDAPKFPSAMALGVLLRTWKQHGDAVALERVERALEAMRANGLWDQLGGGFHRYSTDARWRVPHFEKMLYDNALLVRLYTDAWRATGKPRWEQTVRAALGYLVREMRAPGGAFFATQDADSEGEEGKFFVWTPAEVRRVLGEADGELACRLWGVAPGGNFEHGATVLFEARTIGALAAEAGGDEREIASRIESARARLLEVRERRPKPFRDEKILATWNGLVIGAFAHAGGAFDDDVLRDVARGALGFVRAELWKDGRLLRVHTNGESRVDAFLEDWGDLAEAALDVFEMCGDPSALELGRDLVDGAIERFWDSEHQGFFFAQAGAADLIVRAKDPYDNATPSGTSSMCHALLRLHALTDDDRYQEHAERTLRTLAGPALEGPLGFGHLIGALDRLVRGPTEIVVVGPSDDPRTRALLAVARRAYDGNAVVVPVDAGFPAPALAVRHTSMAMRDGAPTAYVCRARACSAPVTTADELGSLLR